jgi:predicted nucleotide-binding protein (sugar kinase/HSP70/actin superfamily)
MWGREKNKRKHKKKEENRNGESNKEITKRSKNKRKICQTFCKLLKLLLLIYAAYKVSIVQKKIVGFHSWSQNHILKHFMGNKFCDLPSMYSDQEY